LGRRSAERNALVVDRFFETKQQALTWANSHPPFMSLQVVQPNQQIGLPLPKPSIVPANAPRLASNTTSAAQESLPIARNPLCRLGR
jgi:hypothetical protein